MRPSKRLLAGALAVAAAFPIVNPAHAVNGGIIVGTTDTVRTLDSAKRYSFYCSNIYNNVDDTLVFYPAGSAQIAPSPYPKSATTGCPTPSNCGRA